MLLMSQAPTLRVLSVHHDAVPVQCLSALPSLQSLTSLTVRKQSRCPKRCEFHSMHLRMQPPHNTMCFASHGLSKTSAAGRSSHRESSSRCPEPATQRTLHTYSAV